MAETMDSSSISVLKIRNFSLLLTGRLVSASGTSVFYLVATWLIYDQTKSTLFLALFALCQFLPGVTFGLLAGAISDRYDRRKLAMLADLGRAASVSLLALSLFLWGFNVSFLLIVAVLASTLSSIFRPSIAALLTSIVKGTKDVQNAHGFLDSALPITQSASSALAGLIIVSFGSILGLFYNSVAYFFSAMMLLLIIIPKVQPNTSEDVKKKSSLAEDMKEGLVYMRNHKGILQITFASMSFNFFSALSWPFFVEYSRTFLGPSALYYTAIVGAFSLGLAIGSILVGRINAVKFAGKLFGLSNALYGFAFLFMILAPNLYLAIAIQLTNGILLGLYNTTFHSLIQLIVPSKIIGRIRSIDEVGSYGTIPLSQVFAVFAISFAGLGTTFLLSGVGALLTGLVMLSLRDLRNLSYSEPLSS
ncbi:MAG: MFS transporter [Nitrososphaerales archaeon]